MRSARRSWSLRTKRSLVDRFTKRVVAIDEGRVVSDGMDGYYQL